MTRFWFPLLVLGVLLIPAATAVAQDDETIGVAVGTRVTGPIPVEDLEGKPVDLATYLGKKPTVIEFWATWCPLCEALMPQFEAARTKYGSRVQLVIVAVGVGQSRNAVRRHAQRHPMPGVVLWDANGAATRAFQAPSTSYVVTLDAQGKVTYTGLGDRQRIDLAIQKAGAK